MDSSTVNHLGEIELEDVSPSRKQRLPRIASDSSLHSDIISDEESWEHANDEDIKSSREFTVEEENVVIRKLDRHLVLFIAFLYMLSFLDRSSESNLDLRRV